MYRSRLTLATLLLILVPFLVPFLADAADDPGIIGNNLGLDFYSRIDDAGDSLAQGIIRRRLIEKGTYGSLGCGASWLASQAIRQSDLDALRDGNTAILVQLASIRRVSLTTDSESSLRQCLVEKYNQIDQRAHQDQDTLETVGNVGLYLDGDTANSDYDLVADITRINAIIFKEKYDYTGTRNATSQAIAAMLAGKAFAGIVPVTLFPSSSPVGSSPLGSPESPSTASGSSEATPLVLPWAGVCTTGGGASSTSGGLFGDGFFDDIGSAIAGKGTGEGTRNTPTGIVGGSDSGSVNPFGLSEKSDFYHQPSCDGVFCITVATTAGSQNGLGGFANTSIESLLEQHTKMMEPISYSDLGCNFMAGNSFEQSSKGGNFAKQLAGAKVYMSDEPQPKENHKTEDTPAAKDAVFDAAFRCAMAEAGLPSDPILANGFIGAGLLGPRTTAQVAERTTPLGPSEMERLAGCYRIRIGQGPREAYTSLSTDLNEIQGFTDAMMQIIKRILDTDTALDTKPFCTRNM